MDFGGEEESRLVVEFIIVVIGIVVGFVCCILVGKYLFLFYVDCFVINFYINFSFMLGI